MTTLEFPGPSLTMEQWSHIKALASSLSPRQMGWVSGYFAGFDDAGQDAAGLLDRGAPRTEVTIGDTKAVRTLTVLYGSETDNCAALARTLGDRLHAVGRAPSVIDMGDYKLRRLKDEQDLLIVTSTHGEGDPPQAAADFFEFVESRKAPSLPQLQYSVLALGDSTYGRYCEAGRRLDRRFEELGAVRLHPRVDCDIDDEPLAEAWIAAVLSSLALFETPGEVRTTAVVYAEPAAPSWLDGATAVVFDKRHPFPAPIIDNFVMTGRGSSKETRHVEVSLAGSGLMFEPGDSLSIAPRNDPILVEMLLESLRLTPTTSVTLKTGATTLGEALDGDLEITAATPRFLELWATLSGAPALQTLTHQESAPERNAFLRAHQIIDIVRDFPMSGLDPQDLVAGLRPLQPRLYSIASSSMTAPDEAHLTVSTVRYSLHGLARSGVASGHLADRTPIDSVLPVYVQPNPQFRLPALEAPILMIGAGTGVAPFRAFLQEREAQEASGRTWLVFGERNFRTDFLYQTEWQGFLKDGVLSRMDVAFSRDEDRKVYVQDRLRERAAEVFAWLGDGAHIYVCGDAARLAPDVHEALAWILEQQGGLSREAAEDHLRGLQRDRRYQRDVY
jgi:sulfite reductase (NADPH) flavoprotein alpha-component